MRELTDLSSAEQEGLLDRLTEHAHWKMQRLKWRGARLSRGRTAPGGYEPYDVALEALSDFLDGDSRKWNREKYPSLEQFLKSVIDSKISNLVNLLANKVERSIPALQTRDGQVVEFDLPGPDCEPLVVMVDGEAFNILCTAARKEIGDDPMLMSILECMEADITKPAEIAEAISTLEKPVSVDDVYNALKRFERKLRKLDTRTTTTKGGKK